jgi:RimJ/RimL family protein N-acetyltransferase
MITGSKIIIRDKKLSDAKDDYSWRIDPELAYLDAAPVMKISFGRYLSEYMSELHYPSFTRHQFAIDTLDGKHIGNCLYYGINKAKGETELGIMIGNRDCWDKGYGAEAVISLVNHIFQRTNLRRIHLKTLISNNRAQKCFLKCGFTAYGRQSSGRFRFLLMELHRKEWEKQQAELETIK